jgi:hypothetical protein
MNNVLSFFPQPPHSTDVVASDTGDANTRGAILYSCSSSHAHRKGGSRPYFGEIDYLAVYCPETQKVYLLPEQELTATKAHLRVSPTRNKMAKTIRWASLFELA